jgi:type IV secretory pathway TrbL component
MISMPETISVFEAIPVLEMPSSVLGKAMAAKATPGKPSEMATATETATAATETATAATEASTMPATSSASSAMAAASSASSAMSECSGGRNRQNTGQNEADKETVK